MKKVLFALLTFAGGAIALPTGNTAYARGDVVTMNGSVAPGTIIVRTNERRLYYVTTMGQAIRYVVGVRPGRQAMGGDLLYHREIHLSGLVTTGGNTA